jgi:hypothetical protein
MSTLTVDWIVYSPGGRMVQSFSGPEACARWLRERRDNGVTYELWQVVRQAYEVAPGHLDYWVDGTLGLLEPPPTPPPC